MTEEEARASYEFFELNIDKWIWIFAQLSIIFLELVNFFLIKDKRYQQI